MDLFDRLLGRQERPPDPQAPLSALDGMLGIAVSAMAASGGLSDYRLDQVARVARTLEPLADGDPDRVCSSLERAVQLCQRQGPYLATQRAAEVVPAGRAAMAFAIAADLVLSDPAGREHAPAYLAYLRDNLSVDRRVAGRIEDVMRVRHGA